MGMNTIKSRQNDARLAELFGIRVTWRVCKSHPCECGNNFWQVGDELERAVSLPEGCQLQPCGYYQEPWWNIGSVQNWHVLPEYGDTYSGAGAVIDRMRELGWLGEFHWHDKPPVITARFWKLGEPDSIGCRWQITPDGTSRDAGTVPAAVRDAAISALEAEKEANDDETE